MMLKMFLIGERSFTKKALLLCYMHAVDPLSYCNIQSLP